MHDLFGVWELVCPTVRDRLDTAVFEAFRQVDVTMCKAKSMLLAWRMSGQLLEADHPARASRGVTPKRARNVVEKWAQSAKPVSNAMAVMAIKLFSTRKRA